MNGLYTDEERTQRYIDKLGKDIAAMTAERDRLALDFANCADVGRRLESQLAAMTAERDTARIEARARWEPIKNALEADLDAEKARCAALAMSRDLAEQDRAAARTERDAANAARELQWKELQSARADAAAMLAAARCSMCDGEADCIGEYEGTGEGSTFACDDHCGHGNEDGHCRPLSDAGRALLVERDRLREENAALTKRVADMEAHDRNWMDKYDDLNSRYSFKIVETEEQHAVTKSALGRAHAALSALIVPAKALHLSDGHQWSPEVLNAFAKAEALTLAVLADPTGRAAAEYVAALEAEHEAAAELKVSVDLRGVKAAIRFTDAHAAVEALRTAKP